MPESNNLPPARTFAAYVAFLVFICGVQIYMLDASIWIVPLHIFLVLPIRLTPVAYLLGLTILFVLTPLFLLNPPATETIQVSIRIAQAAVIAGFALAGRLIAPDRLKSSNLHARLMSRGLYWGLGGVMVLFSLMRPFSWPDSVAWAVAFWSIAGSLRCSEKVPRSPRFSIRNVLVNATILAVSVVLALAIVEFGSRALMGNQEVALDNYEPHPEYVFLYRPNSRVLHYAQTKPDGYTGYTIAVSSQGLRDREYAPKQRDETRILMLGDSFTMGAGVRPELSIPKSLERVLTDRRTDRKISVINAGMGGAGPLQHLGIWRIRARELNPDIVVLQLYVGNDIDNSLEGVGESLRAYLPSWKQHVHAMRMQQNWYYRLEFALIRHSNAYRLLRRAKPAKALVPALIQSFRFVPREKYRLPPNEPRAPALEPDLVQWYPELERGFDLFCELLLQLRREVESTGASFLVYAIPVMSQVDDEKWNELTGSVDRAYERMKSIRVLEEFLHESEIAYIDVAGVLAEQPIEETYFVDDGHTSVEGNALVASVIADYLEKRVFSDLAIKTETGKPMGSGGVNSGSRSASAHD